MVLQPISSLGLLYALSPGIQKYYCFRYIQICVCSSTSKVSNPWYSSIHTFSQASCFLVLLRVFFTRNVPTEWELRELNIINCSVSSIWLRVAMEIVDHVKASTQLRGSAVSSKSPCLRATRGNATAILSTGDFTQTVVRLKALIACNVFSVARVKGA